MLKKEIMKKENGQTYHHIDKNKQLNHCDTMNEETSDK